MAIYDCEFEEKTINTHQIQYTADDESVRDVGVIYKCEVEGFVDCEVVDVNLQIKKA